jgi:hypothetical protein
MVRDRIISSLTLVREWKLPVKNELTVIPDLTTIRRKCEDLGIRWNGGWIVILGIR